ncbi:hypothetical protein [Psychrobacter immobilis]|uniref:hypothetical protein n=1 Tax=Psychrobacter immobilis TaxID=498 RepID=UPI00191B551B|nr:hypothetical protein [Psychrobacter immobilis]
MQARIEFIAELDKPLTDALPSLTPINYLLIKPVHNTPNTSERYAEMQQYSALFTQ